MSLNETAEKVKEVKKIFRRESRDNGVYFEKFVKLITKKKICKINYQENNM
jgi:hypothetical protein